MKNSSGHGFLASVDEVESSSVSAVDTVSFRFSDKLDGRATNSSTGMIFTVGFSGSSDISVRLQSSLSNSGSRNCKVKSYSSPSEFFIYIIKSAIELGLEVSFNLGISVSVRITLMVVDDAICGKGKKGIQQ